MKAFVLLLMLALSLPSSARAEDAALPFALPCPDTRYCNAGESGSWVPAWYQREVAKDMVKLDGVSKELAHAEAEIRALRLAQAELERERGLLKEMVIRSETQRKALEQDVHKLRAQKVRRTRWALATTVATVLLAGALSAIGYVAAH